MNRTYFIRLTKNSSVDFGTGHYYIDHLGEGGVGVGVGRKILFVSQYHLPVFPPPPPIRLLNILMIPPSLEVDWQSIFNRPTCILCWRWLISPPESLLSFLSQKALGSTFHYSSRTRKAEIYLWGTSIAFERSKIASYFILRQKREQTENKLRR